MPLEIGHLLQHDRYRIEGLLGQGGMGAVYKAYDTSLDMDVAIKENLETSPEAQKQFNREANILAHLSHPNLTRVTDYFYIPKQGQYLVMDYVEGEDLQSMLKRLGRLPEPQVLIWIGQITDALAYLHSQKPPIIHRDIKPSNIKIRPDGRAMLVDFGIAKIFNPHLATTIGAKMVTPGYSPPEQYGGGSTDTRSDIYALGATLFHLLTGQEPPESIMRVVNESLMPPVRQVNPEVSPQVEQLILKSVELSTERRFQTAGELSAALQSSTRPPGKAATPATPGKAAPAEASATKVLPASEIAVPPPPPAVSQVEKPRRKIPIWVWIGGGGAAAVCLLLVVMGVMVSGALLSRRGKPTQAILLAPTATSAVTRAPTAIPTIPTIPTRTQPPTPAPQVSPTVAASPTADNTPPTSYTLVASLVVPDQQSIRSVGEKDGYAYVLTKLGKLHVFDLTQLSRQQSFTAYASPLTSLTLQNSNGLSRNGDFLYVYGNRGFQIIEVKDASKPVLKTEVSDLIVYSIRLQGKYLIATGTEQFIIYDASNPLSPRLLSKTTTGSGSTNFASAIYQDRLYISQYTTTATKAHGLIMVYDFSDPTRSLTNIQRIDAQELAYHIEVTNGMLIRCNTNDVEVWDLSQKDAPHYESSARGQARVCALDRGNIVVNGTVLSLSGNSLGPLVTFDPRAEAGDISSDKLGQTENYPYGSAVTPQFVFLAQAGRVIILASDTK